MKCFNFYKLTWFCLQSLLVTPFLSSCISGESEEPVDCDASAPTLVLQSKTDSECNLATGTISVTASGGSGELKFQLNNGDFLETDSFSELPAGSYQVTVKDENNCTATLSVSIVNLDGLNISTSTTDAGCGTSNGSITVTGFDGQEPYSFKINNGNFQASNMFQNLAAGNYQITAKDATDCETTTTVSIKTGISFSSSVQAIITNNCAVSGCHSGTQSPDFRNFNTIQANAARIKTRTGNGSMPPNGTLTQAQINAIACWVDDGALNN